MRLFTRRKLSSYAAVRTKKAQSNKTHNLSFTFLSPFIPVSRLLNISTMIIY